MRIKISSVGGTRISKYVLSTARGDNVVMMVMMMRIIMMRLKPKCHLCSAAGESAKAREWIFLLASPLVNPSMIK